MKDNIYVYVERAEYYPGLFDLSLIAINHDGYPVPANDLLENGTNLTPEEVREESSYYDVADDIIIVLSNELKSMSVEIVEEFYDYILDTAKDVRKNRISKDLGSGMVRGYYERILEKNMVDSVELINTLECYYSAIEQ